jgi:hypothetical protein
MTYLELALYIFCGEIELFCQHCQVHPLNKMQLVHTSVSVVDCHLAGKQPGFLAYLVPFIYLLGVEWLLLPFGNIKGRSCSPLYDKATTAFPLDVQ